MPTPTPVASCSAFSARATGSRSSASATASPMVRSTGPASAESGVAPEAGEWPRLVGRFGPQSKRPLPEADAPPLAELVADIPVGAGQSEAEGLVQPRARRIRQGDRRDRLGEALRLEQWDQCA